MSEHTDVKCPICGYERSGDWLDGQRICYHCGRHFRAEEEKAPDGERTGRKKQVVVVWMRAYAYTTSREDKAIFPYEDGTYTFEGKEYPFTNFKGIQIEGDTFKLKDITSRLTEEGFEVHLQPSVAYDHSGVAWPEYLDIKVYLDNIPDKD